MYLKPWKRFCLWFICPQKSLGLKVMQYINDAIQSLMNKYLWIKYVLKIRGHCSSNNKKVLTLYLVKS